jgi:hypothetical protein
MRRQHARGRTTMDENSPSVVRRPPSFSKENQFMDPIATLFLVLIIILVVASILIPQIQERRRR